MKSFRGIYRPEDYCKKTGSVDLQRASAVLLLFPLFRSEDKWEALNERFFRSKTETKKDRKERKIMPRQDVLDPRNPDVLGPVHPAAYIADGQQAVDSKYESLGGNKGLLGAPVGGMKDCADFVGFFRQYSGGVIYWTRATGAHEVHGAILEKWASLESERSSLGYPISDESPGPENGDRVSKFQNGIISFAPQFGAIVGPLPAPSRSWDADVRFADSTPLGGSIHIAMDRHGAFTFSGHMHDSGFDPIAFTIVAAVVTASGMVYGFGFSGRCGGTIAGGVRDCDWVGMPTNTFKDEHGNVVPNPNPAIAANWPQIVEGNLTWRITSQDLAVQWVADAALELGRQAVGAGTKALIAML